MITEEKRTRWLKHVERWKESRQSINKYCLENGINKSTFRYWIEGDRKKTKSGSFVKLTIPKQLPVKNVPAIILKYGAYEIRLPFYFEEAELNRILDLLEGRA